jgi:hypothetical protein
VKAMIWVPPWLAKAYARIYSTKRTETFDFSEAAEILGIKDERPLAKTVAKLKGFGYLTTRRDPIDPRRKMFRLVDPQSIVLAMAIQSRAKTNDVTEKLREASSTLDYYVNGAYAAYQYHHYSAAASMDISVRPDQLFTWIALVSEPKLALSINDIPAERPAETNVHLRSEFDEKLSEHITVIDGIRFLSPEILIILGITRENPTLEDALAILVVHRTKLDWKKLLKLAEAYSATRYLGCILEVLNSESQKPLFEKSLIAKLHRQSNLDARLDFPASMKSQRTERLYEDISSKWNLRLHLTHALVSKILTDLVR